MAYASEVVDIVTAYKSLKLVMTKNVKGLAEGREQCTGKGYLKPTMASRQQTRGHRPPLIGGGAPQAMPPGPDAMLPLINRGHTAPTLVGQRGHSRSTRAHTRGSYRTRGIDGQPLPPRPPQAARTTSGFQGMTLQDYATGNLWGRNTNKMASSSSGGLFGRERSGSRQATAPCWRKTRAERVDEKIARLKRSEIIAAAGSSNELLMSEREKRSKLVSQYFPGQEKPLAAYQNLEEKAADL